MPRIFVILTAATVLVFGGLFVQYKQQQHEAEQLQIYQSVLLDKTQQIFEQAKDSEKPIKVNVKDERLEGDYQVMASFVLQQMIQSAEARNSYIRELKTLGWERFLDADRLIADKKKAYVETEAMLKKVHAMVDAYALKIDELEHNSLVQAKDLPVDSKYSSQLAQSLRDSRKNDDAHLLFDLEKQSLAKADAIFVVLKNNKWERRNKLFMFYEDKPLNDFNALYKEMVELNKQMRQVSLQNRAELNQKL